ncbi:MAG TPA: formyltransferase family protein [Candidatus Nanoarchaeia archaeon]|nr:formyltransferase family protein [Candidatus Nanoarchaeia archaeon]
MAKIILFTQNTMASVVASREIIRKNHAQISAVVLASQLKGESVKDQAKIAYKLIKKSSLSFFGYKLVESRLYNLLLKGHRLVKSRKYLNDEAKTIEELAEKHNLRLIKANDLSSQEFLGQIKDLNPDYILCLVSQILKKNVFETLGNRLINAHGSYLPEYRGAAQYVFYLKNNDPQFGVTIHFMEPGLDSGPIIFQRKFAYDRNGSMYKLHHQIAWQFGQMLNEFMENYASLPQIKTIVQDEGKATYTRMPLKEDIAGVRENGCKLLTIRDFLNYL